MVSLLEPTLRLPRQVVRGQNEIRKKASKDAQTAYGQQKAHRGLPDVP